MWLRGRWYERPPAGHCDSLSHLDWRGWFDAAAAEVARQRRQEARAYRAAGGVAAPPLGGPQGAPNAPDRALGGGVSVAFLPAGDDLASWAPGTSSLDTVGISRQVPENTGQNLETPSDVISTQPAGVVARLEALAAVTSAQRAEWAAECMERARTSTALVSRAWWRGRAAGWERRMRAAAECGTRMAWVATCAGCAGDRAPVPLRCGLTRECPRCRGAELGRRSERVRALMAEAEALTVRERARHGPTIARPLGPWGWRFVSLPIPPGAGVRQDARDLRPAFAVLMRKLATWARVEGHEDRAPLRIDAVEGTVGVSRDGHVHLHVLLMSPFVPHALLRRMWGEALLARHARREVPHVTPERAAEGVTHAGTARLVTHTRRGAAGRQLAAVPWPVLDVRKADASAVAELAKYAVKGVEMPDEADVLRWADVWCSLARMRLFASSRTLASAPHPEPVSHLACEGCGLVGQWAQTVQRQRGPPEGAQRYECRAVLGMA